MFKTIVGSQYLSVSPPLNVKIFFNFMKYFQCFVLQDPLLRRMDGAQNIPLTSIIPTNSPTSRIKLWMKNYKFTAKKIDVLSRVCFPGSFFTFTFFYWTYFLTRNPGQKKDG